MGRAEEGDGFADRRVQTIKQLHVDRRGKRYRDSLRAPGSGVRAQRRGVVVPVERQDDAARAVVLDRAFRTRVRRRAAAVRRGGYRCRRR